MMICLALDLFVRLTCDRYRRYRVEIRMGGWRFSPVSGGSPASERWLDRHMRWTMLLCVFAAIGADQLVFFASGLDDLTLVWIFAQRSTCSAQFATSAELTRRITGQCGPPAAIIAAYQDCIAGNGWGYGTCSFPGPVCNGVSGTAQRHFSLWVYYPLLGMAQWGGTGICEKAFPEWWPDRHRWSHEAANRDATLRPMIRTA
jgi:hypothetical protein